MHDAEAKHIEVDMITYNAAISACHLMQKIKSVQLGSLVHGNPRHFQVYAASGFCV
jgi:hypothetical protein